MAADHCFLNGRYLRTRNARVSALDRGLLFGEGLFETWRTYRGKPFALREHLARMSRSADKLGIDFDPDEPWDTRTVRLTRLCGLGTTGGALRLTITRGSGPISLVATQTVRPTKLMVFRPLEPGLAKARRNGVAVHLADFGHGVFPAMRQTKSVNYLPAVLARGEARKRGCFESLYRLSDKTVLEGTTSNFFIVRHGRLLTPPVAAGIIPGVTRALVMRIARRFVEVIERRVTENDLLTADEMFITSSTIEIVPVTKVGRRRVGRGEPGPVTAELQARYRSLVARRMGMAAGELGE